MAGFLKNRWFLLLVLVVFVIIKIPALSFPFFWDESWSYEPGVKLMYEHGPSLMPNAIDLFYSRGHPLLFYATAAAWMRIFGDSHISQHTFSLTISLLLLVSIYEVCLRVFSQRVAVLSLLLVAFQVMFFVQSTFVLPEVMIALLTVLTLYFYTAEKYIYTFLCCSALLLTKESGVVLALVLGVHATLKLFDKTEAIGSRAKNFFSVFCSGIVIGTFFLVQKKINGWFFFPQHMGLIVLNWDTIKGKMRFAFEVIFFQQSRSRIFQLLLLLCIIVSVQLRNFKLVLPVILGILVYIIVDEDFGYVSRKMLYPVLFAITIYVAYLLSINYRFKSLKSRKFVILGIIFFLVYIVFTVLNFFTLRYLLCAFSVLVILAAAYIDFYISQLYNLIYYLTVACILVISICSFADNDIISDTELSAFPAMEVQEDIVTWCEKNNLYDKYIGTFSSLEMCHLNKPYTGFLHTGKTFKNVEYDIYRLTEYVIFDNIEYDKRYSDVRKDTGLLHADLGSWQGIQLVAHQIASGGKLPSIYISERGDKYRLVYRTAHGQVWGEIYKRE